MRTPRRPLALAATLSSALLGVGLLAGASPAAAAAQDPTSAISNCSVTSVGPDGSLDPDAFQVCLDQVQASLTFEAAEETEEYYEVEEPAVVEVEAYDVPRFDALDVAFAFEAPEAPEAPAVPAEEIAPVDNGLGDAFAALRECESGGSYTINTGNGYYGAYQFALSTWQGLGYGGYPHHASPAVQDQAARELQALYGWGQWPGCSWYLGL
jgi:hypothetical protein